MRALSYQSPLHWKIVLEAFFIIFILCENLLFMGIKMRRNKFALSLTTLALIVLMIPVARACEPPLKGKITGGGHGALPTSPGIPGGSFGFNVMWSCRDPSPKGELNYVDHDTGMHVHAHVISWLKVWGSLPGNKPWPMRHGAFGGPCTIDGEEGHWFACSVQDTGEPGGENDVFAIRLSNGYSAGNSLLCGNIQIHKPPK